MVGSENPDTIGLTRGVVKLLPHNPLWQNRFKVEAKLLQQKLGLKTEDIQHVGSTSIAGIFAKPIIDIAILVGSLTVVDNWIKLLAEIGYFHDGPEVVPGRRFFTKGPKENRTVYLHIVTLHEYNRLLLFRDKLRSNAALAKEYSDLKVKLAASLADDRKKYTSKKDEFIKRVLRTSRDVA